ncbi:hypothetical protein Ga0466249_004855 [Sporomusaceae bacterium BoRhaA]|uniref:amidase domain-containing protein n=1 Tax=Pelorhabdus rhamnosifermentans TaxID=2772457 RepID=UPI001C05F8C9|nr:amidase domain-containing protein [Pelorhabdus rhamnosifermentans]MBU2703707.1 hypothetical protein [Pelorhabdus rhamnosifermentans]
MSFFEELDGEARELVKRQEYEWRHKNDLQSQTFSFSRQQAVYYAHYYWSDINTGYPYFGGDDCTNFVSQCWVSAGIPETANWFCDPIEEFEDPRIRYFTGDQFIETRSWQDADVFGNYMVNQGYCRMVYSSIEANLGDVIQFYNSEHGWHHSAIITQIDPNGDLHYTAHSDAHLDRPLSDVYPQNGEELRFLCPYNAY